MRSNLFVKVFVAFWIVTCAVLGSWVLVSTYFEERPSAEFVRGKSASGRPHRFVLRTLYELQNSDLSELERTLENARTEHGLDIFLFDASGDELFGRRAPESARALAARLDGKRRRISVKTPRERLVGHSLYRSEEGPVRAVFQFAPRRGALLPLLGGSPTLRIVLAALISGLICYALSRALTRRLKALQAASRRLANGDLDTRLIVRDRGGDETDELARDFNSMASQLQERIQAQKRLLSDVSHELRSPLARLRIALALAQEDESSREAHMQRIETEAQRLEELIGQLLSSEVRPIALDDHIDLVALLQHLCEDARFEGQAQHKGVVLRCDLTAAVVPSHGDLLHKCFDNVLRNAIAHTPQHSDVVVTLTAQDNSYTVSIADRGPGVSEGELDKIFDPFYRVDTARTRESGGFGLGLSIARRAVLQHGGAIHAQNTGNGLMVVVTLLADERPLA